MKKKYEIVILKGDGIGPEVCEEAIKVIETVSKRFNVSIQLKEEEIGASAIRKTGKALPEKTLSACKQADAVLLGAIGDPEFGNSVDPEKSPEKALLTLRKELGLYCNIRPIVCYESLMPFSPLKKERILNTDILILRELTGGIYFGEKKLSDHEAYDICTYNENEIERIATKAFEYALTRRKKVTVVDKANVLATSKLWRNVIEKLSVKYPSIELNFQYVDNASMQLLLNPSAYDVILTENMFGDILSDEASVIPGSIGLIPSASLGEKHALFEPIHGSFPEGKNKSIANPIGTILSCAMLFDYLGLTKSKMAIIEAVNKTIAQQILTPELSLKESYSTKEVGDCICSFLSAGNKSTNYKNILIGNSTII